MAITKQFRNIISIRWRVDHTVRKYGNGYLSLQSKISTVIFFRSIQVAQVHMQYIHQFIMYFSFTLCPTVCKRSSRNKAKFETFQWEVQVQKVNISVKITFTLSTVDTDGFR